MRRAAALKAVLILVGLLFFATVIPVIMFVGPSHHTDALPMMLSLYVTLGIFLLLAARNPSAYRSLIAFTAWSSFAHAAVMVVQSLYDGSERIHLLSGVGGLIVIGVALITLALAKGAPKEAA